jgi:mannose-1-phosphate guanylyltransferase
MSEEKREAILLVGGRGTRLAPLTDAIAKPMLPVGGVPFIAHQIAQAQAAGINKIVLATSYLAQTFTDYFGDGSDFGVELIYAVEESALGTGGAIRNAAEFLSGTPDSSVVIFNGDVLSGHDLPGQIAAHKSSNADVTLYLTKVKDARAYGCVPCDESGRVLDFLEKMENPITDLINAGCYIFKRSIIDQIPANKVVSVERETFPNLLSGGANIRGFIDNSYWLDVGTPQALLTASRDLAIGKISSPAVANKINDCVISPSAKISSTAKISGGSTIGEEVTVEDGVEIIGSIISDGVQVSAKAQIKNSILGRAVTVGHSAQIIGSVVADGEKIAEKSVLRQEISLF